MAHALAMLSPIFTFDSDKTSIRNSSANRESPQKSPLKKNGPKLLKPQAVELLREVLARPAGFDLTTPWFLGNPLGVTI
jgi:hypothetical protein